MTQGAQKPQALPVQADSIPPELRVRRQWVLWRYEYRPESKSLWTKVPYQVNGQRASSTNPDTWTTFEAVVEALLEHPGRFDGVGFVLCADDPFAGIDLDHCRDTLDESIAPWAKDIIERLNSCTEVTPSGTGIRIFVKAKLPPGGRKKGNFEVYESGRFLTITGHHLEGTPLEIHERQAELEGIHKEQFSQPQGAHAGDSWADDYILDRMFKAKNGDKARRLWNGDWSDYPSQSEADQALCNMLSFWTDRNPARIDEMFRKSGLYRKKWDERHFSDGRTYGQATIETAVRHSGSYFSGNGHHRESEPVSANEHPPMAETTHLTDMGNAWRLVRLHGQDIRYCWPWQKWLVWDGTRWAEDVTGEIFRLARDVPRQLFYNASSLAAKAAEETSKTKLAEAAQEVLKWARISEGRNRLEALVSLARSEPGIPVRPEELDPDGWLLNCRNGTINLKTGQLQEHQRENLISKLAPVIYDPAARLDLWEKFLERVLPNSDTRDFVQRASGYSVTGLISEEKLFFAYGNTSTGKSTFLKGIAATLGDYAITADFGTFLQQDRRSSGPSADIARLAGRRFVVSIEVDSGQRMAEAVVKQLTGGDVVAARKMYQETFEFTPTCKLWLAANDQPQVRDDDNAMWRRILQIPFDQQIPEEERDPNVKATLTDPEIAGPAILRWLVEGCLNWQLIGLKPPQAVLDATAEYRREMDLLKDFLDDCCIVRPDVRVPKPDLRKAYEDWCKDNGYRYPLTPNAWGRRLAAKGFQEVRSHGVRYWQGVGLITDKLEV
jgi:putative DNA primase/helicase